MRSRALLSAAIATCALTLALTARHAAPSPRTLEPLVLESLPLPSAARPTGLPDSMLSAAPAPLTAPPRTLGRRSAGESGLRAVQAVRAEGASARLRGFVSRDGRGCAATLEFLAGPNRGTTITTQPDGTLRADALYPGFSVCSIRAGGELCQREFVLRHRADTSLELDFAGYGRVVGSVLDASGSPIASARVSLDGAEVRSGLHGEFSLEARASGCALLLVHAPGFVPYREALAEGTAQVSIQLRRGARLSLSVRSPDAEDEIVVYLFPTAAERMSGRVPAPAYPWHELNPIRLAAGSVLELDDLPLTRVEARAFSADSSSASVSAWLTTEKLASIALEMVAAPKLAGRVVRGAEPVPGACIELCPLDPLRATQIALGASGRFYLSQPIELLPSTRQAVLSDAQGHFRVALWDRPRGSSFLSATAGADARTFELDAAWSADVRIDLSQAR